MKILQISNDFFGSKVHASLYKELSKQGIRQTIYCPIKSEKQKGKNAFSDEGTEIIYDKVLKPYHSLVYHLKRRDIFRSLEQKVDLKSIDLCHATTLFTDGGQAYKIFKKYGIPYVVAVRSTDVDSFLKIAPHTWLSGKKILQNASKIVFITPALKKKFCNHWFIKTFLSDIESKLVVQPNGIDNYWIDNAVAAEKDRNKGIVYVGTFIRRKHVVRLMKAVVEARKTIPELQLHLIGGGGSDEARVASWVAKYPDCLLYHGKINDKDKLRSLYLNNSIFAMPSVRETFGLVYVEAMTQGMALVYTKNDGVDGLFDVTVGESVNAYSSKDIKTAIIKIINHPEAYMPAEPIDFEQFRWNSIAVRYNRIYQQILSGV